MRSHWNRRPWWLGDAGRRQGPCRDECVEYEGRAPIARFERTRSRRPWAWAWRPTPSPRRRAPRKELNKKALLESAGLPYVHEVPLIGIVSRLAWQKGFDLCFDVLPRMLANRAVQLIVLGTGEPKYEALFTNLARRFPRQVAYLSSFSEPVAHLIEAGSDMFLMPSRYEPCGLNQMYSLRYGTVPIVHRTGGLADTVSPFDRATGRGNGFVFDHFDETGLTFALSAALRTWGSGTGADRATWRKLQANGMGAHFSWRRCAAPSVA